MIYLILFANFVNIFSSTGIKQSPLSQPIQHNKGKKIGYYKFKTSFYSLIPLALRNHFLGNCCGS